MVGRMLITSVIFDLSITLKSTDLLFIIMPND